VPTDATFAARGSGGMAKAVLAALRDAGFRFGTVVARNADQGLAPARTYGFEWSPEPRALRPQLLVNVTPIGMAGLPEADDLAFEPAIVETADTVFDVVALPEATPLITLARSVGKPVITGTDVMALQALEQFVLYAGIPPAAAYVARAIEFARG
jgi:shikimate dehydrogenase